MSHIRARGPAAILGAIILLISIAGCGSQPSILAPSDESLGREVSSQAMEESPEARPPGSPGYMLWNRHFRFINRAGGYSLDPSTWHELEVAAGARVPVNWIARARGRAHVRAYRWTLDIEDVFDNTPRINEATDLNHWSMPSPNTRRAIVGPFAAGEQHLFYVEIEDSNGYKSLATIHMTVVGAAAGAAPEEEVRLR